MWNVKLPRILLTAALGLSALGLWTSSASAITSSVSGIIMRSGGNITQASLGKVTFRAGTTRVECNVTLSGSFERALVRAENAIGGTTAMSWRECTGGNLRAGLFPPPGRWIDLVRGLYLIAIVDCSVLLALTAAIDWDLVCGTRLRWRFVGMQFSSFGAFSECLYGGTEREEISINAAATAGRTRGEYTLGLATILTNVLRRNAERSEAFCPAEIEVIGSFGAISPTQVMTIL